MESIQQSLTARGHSDEVVELITRSRRPGTRKLYDYRWDKWVDWCNSRQARPFDPTVPQVADFLNELFKKGLAVTTIKGYRAAISRTLKTCADIDLSENPDLCDLMRAMYQQRPRIHHNVPEWNLALVLTKLTQSPYEPPERCTLQRWTWKTVFLIMLASGKRRGEIHALRDNFRNKEDWSSVTFKPRIDFVAKAQSADNKKGTFESVTIPALTLVDDREPEHKLCPVRAFKWYWEKTRARRSRFKEPRPLFLPIQEGRTEPIGPQCISGWVKETISAAYADSTDEDRRLIRPRAHDLRGIGTSWAYRHSLDLQSVLDAAAWSNHSTFTSFYLKDLVEMEGEMYRLGPIVTAQQVVVPPRAHRRK